MANINVTSITVHPVNLQLQLNGYAFVTATVCPTNATCRSVTWTSSNANVATVNSTSGLVMARAAGSATITATATDGSCCYGSCLLTVSALNPIMPKMGGYKQSVTDIRRNAPGMPVSFTRSYDSMNTTVGPFGRGWTFSYSCRCYTSGSYQVVTLPDGTIEYFTVNNMNYVGFNTRDTLVRNSDCTFTLRRSRGMTYYYTAKGYLFKIQDANGNTTTITLHPATNYPIKITDSVCRTYDIHYTNNLIRSITVNDGDGVAAATICYDYDGTLLTAQYNAKGKVVNTYHYNSSCLLQKICDAWNNAQVTVTYANGKMSSLTDENGTQTTYAYSTDADCQLTITLMKGNSSLTEIYDRYNRKLKDSLNKTYQYLNLYGEIEKQTDDFGNTTTYSYDEKGNVTEMLTENAGEGNRRITYQYTYGGINYIKRVETVETTSNDSDAEPTVCVTTEIFDIKGNLSSKTVSDGTKAQTLIFAYYANGLLKNFRDSKNTVIAYEYDDYGNPTKETVTQANREAKTTVNTYNMFGQLLTQTSSDGVVSSYLYDSLENLIKQTVNRNTSAFVTRWVYDDWGRLTQKIEPNEYRVAVDSTPANAHGISSNPTYADTATGIRYAYGSNRKITQKQIGPYTINMNENNRIRNVNSNADHPDSHLVEYHYVDCNFCKMIHAASYLNGQNIVRDYDCDGNVMGVSIDNQPVSVYTYDEHKDMVIKEDLTAGTPTSGFVTTRATVPGDFGVEIKDSSGVTIHKYHYIDGDTFTNHVFNSSYQLGYSSHIVDNNLHTTEDFSDSSFLYSQKKIYNDNLNVVQSYIDNGTLVLLNVDHIYNNQGQLVGRQYTYSDQTRDSFDYTYDSSGNLVSISKNDVQQVKYTYNDVGELIRTDDAVQNKTFVYEYDTCDNNSNTCGNIQFQKTYDYTTAIDISGQIPTAVAAYEYDSDAFPDVLTSYNGQTFTHDANGNPLNYRDGMSLTWQGGRRLSAVSLPGMRIDYTYDDMGIRTSKTVNSITTLYTSIDGRITGQRDSENDNELMFVYDRHDHLICFQWNGAHYLYVRNLQGDITEILDMDGNSIVKYNYSSWGICTISGNLTLGNLNPMRYRGYYYDVETGLYYLQSRYYDPVIGRFINGDDPNVLMIRDNAYVGANLFAYGNNNPVMYIDPQGTIPTFIEAATMAKHIYDLNEPQNQNPISLIGGWQVYGPPLREDGSGPKMVVYRRERNCRTEYALVNRGSYTLEDWKENIQQVYGSSADMKNSINSARNFVQQHPGAEITMVGHSKGGAESTANAVATNKNGIAFNPAPVQLDQYDLSASQYSTNALMVTFVVKGELVDMLLGVIRDRVGYEVFLPQQHFIHVNWGTVVNVFLKGYGEITQEALNVSIENHSMDSVLAALKQDGWW